MTRDEVTQEWCRLSAMVYKSIGDSRSPNDGFCNLCPFADKPHSFRNSGEVIEYVRAAIVRRLKEDGYVIAEGFDPETGKEL